MDIIKRTTDSFAIQDAWVKEIQLLKSIGFSITEPSELTDFQETEPGDIIMAEPFCRRMFVFVLGECHYEGDNNWSFYVQEDVGCGFVNMPVNWWDIERQWIEHFKFGFEGHGFNISI